MTKGDGCNESGNQELHCWFTLTDWSSPLLGADKVLIGLPISRSVLSAPTNKMLELLLEAERELSIFSGQKPFTLKGAVSRPGLHTWLYAREWRAHLAWRHQQNLIIAKKKKKKKRDPEVSQPDTLLWAHLRILSSDKRQPRHSSTHSGSNTDLRTRAPFLLWLHRDWKAHKMTSTPYIPSITSITVFSHNHKSLMGPKHVLTEHLTTCGVYLKDLVHGQNKNHIAPRESEACWLVGASFSNMTCW